MNHIKEQYFAGLESQYFQAGQHRLHFFDEGEGEPVLMVHGNPSWSIYYRNLMQELKSDFRVLVPDHIGCGFSDKPSEKKYNYTLASRVGDLSGLMDSLKIDQPVNLVVHDWGGMIGFAWAIERLEMIKRIVVLNTSAFHLPKSKPLPMRLKIGRNTKLGEYLIRGQNAFAKEAARIGCKRNPMSRELQQAYISPYNSWENRIATHKFVQDIPLKPGDPAYEIVDRVESKLEQVKSIPTQIHWGLKDFVFDHHFLAEWERRFPDAEYFKYPDCGHYILEDAADEVIPRIKEFLNK